MSEKCILSHDKGKASYQTGFYWLGLTNDLTQTNDFNLRKETTTLPTYNPIFNIPAPNTHISNSAPVWPRIVIFDLFHLMTHIN